MDTYNMTDTELKFAELIWDNEPIGSGELVKICSEKFDWKKSTTYTFLKKLCRQQLFQNSDSIVTSLISKDKYNQRQGLNFVEKNYDGSLPKMIAAFMEHKCLSSQQIEEIESMIISYKEGK